MLENSTAYILVPRVCTSGGGLQVHGSYEQSSHDDDRFTELGSRWIRKITKSSAILLIVQAYKYKVCL